MPSFRLWEDANVLKLFFLQLGRHFGLDVIKEYRFFYLVFKYILMTLNPQSVQCFKFIENYSRSGVDKNFIYVKRRQDKKNH